MPKNDGMALIPSIIRRNKKLVFFVETINFNFVGFCCYFENYLFFIIMTIFIMILNKML